ncbi:MULTISPECIES: hypothetical protein [unclassified Streptomyces]|uniref:hypothetical protein n=1 Tax=unclassified Streptomyces TaxID=2593676 RepID=UPI0004C75488|nr:hypothetical protein [Streptomyces sp. NRRL F-5727]
MKKTTGMAAGAVAAGALVAGGWFGYQQWTEPLGGHVLRGYDATSPASTAPHTENVFTGRVAAFEEQRDVEGWTQDVYRVEVASVLRGTVRGTVRVTYGLDEGTTGRLKEGSTYVFATHGWTDTAKDGHAQLYQGEMRPVDDALLTVWKKAAALPVLSER